MNQPTQQPEEVKMTDDEILKRAKEIKDNRKKEAYFQLFDKEEFVSITTPLYKSEPPEQVNSIQVWANVPKNEVRSLVRKHIFEEE